MIILYITEMIGIIAFAVSGAITGIKNKFDLFGVLILGSATALGGGLIRDVLLGYFPPRMFQNYWYLSVASIVSTIVFLFFIFSNKKSKTQKYVKNPLVSKITQQVFTISDALGLAAFTVIGCGYAIESGFDDNAFFVIFLGTLTGVGGGVLRDLLSVNVPIIFTKQIYATASIAGGIIYYFVYNLNNHTASIIAGGVIILIIRYLAAYFNWNLPKA